MLKIFNLKSKYYFNTFYKEKQGNLKELNYYDPSVNREWLDNIYSYNNNTIKLLSSKHNIVYKLIKIYFNMSIPKLDEQIRKIKKLRKRSRPLWKIINSSKRIFISKPEFKHTNDNIFINIYVYNRQRNIILNKYLKLKSVLKNLLFSFKVKNNLELVIKNNFIVLKDKVANISNNSYFNHKNTINKLIKLIEIKKTLYKLNRLMYIRKILFLNSFKFKSTLIIPLIKLLEKIYNKKVILNIVSLNNYFLNSDIMNQVIAYKISKRKHRGKTIKFLRSAMRNIKTPKLSHNIINESYPLGLGVQNILIKKNLTKSFNNDKLTNILKENYLINNENYSNTHFKIIQQDILNSIKNKSVSGIRLEVAGRTTRRITAQRAAYNYRYVGTLKNFDSSYKGLTSVILRGNLSSNVQHTNLKSKTIIGSFGLKGWISSV